jgi:twitching motility protein PilT
VGITAKVALKDFRSAEWADKDAIRAFIQSIDTLDSGDLTKMLGMLLDVKLARDHGRHARRRIAFVALAQRALDPAMFKPYVDALEVADGQTRKALVELLIKVNNVQEHPRLCDMLGNEDSEVRAAAAIVLRQVGGRAAFSYLHRVIRRRDFKGRIEALDALVPKVGYHAVPLLDAVVEAGNPPEQARALEHLGNAEAMAKARPAALAAASKGLETRDPRVLSRALQAVAKLGGEDEFFQLTHGMLGSPRTEVVQAVLQTLAQFGTPRALDVLRRKLHEGPNAVRHTVLQMLGEMGSEDVLPLLVEALSSRQVVVRTTAAEVLAKLSEGGRVQVARTIVWLLRSPDRNIRRTAAELANRVRGEASDLGPQLLEHLTDEDWWVRERVMDALAAMWKKGLTRYIVTYLQDEADTVRRFAIGALKRIKDPASLGALVRCALDDDDWWVRETAVEAIADIGDERAAPYLLSMLDKAPELHLAVIDALRMMRVREAAEPVAELLSAKEADVRFAAIRCLDTLGDRSVGLWLKGCEKDEAPRVRLAARNLLAKWSVSPDAEVPAVVTDSGLERLLLALIKAGGEDLIIGVGRPPFMKRHGEVSPLSDEPMTEDAIQALLADRLNLEQRQRLADGRDVDFSYNAKLAETRFRANVFKQMHGTGIVFRAIRREVADLGALGLPEVVQNFGNLKNGLVLVGGPTGAGKSTTLAALVNHINETDGRHILTIEDPIEMVHIRKKCLINQREVGTHTHSFEGALRSSLREDPDVILIGEMRDLETIAFAVTAAETGHLVFGTVHTVSADKSIDRMINAFPAQRQGQVRSMLSETLRGVVCQHLLKRKDREGRVIAVEVMVGNDAVSALVRNGKTFQLASVIATSADQGMQSMDRELSRLVNEGVVDFDEAYMKAVDKSAFEGMVHNRDDDDDTRSVSGVPGQSVPPPTSAKRPAGQLPASIHTPAPPRISHSTRGSKPSLPAFRAGVGPDSGRQGSGGSGER